MHSPTPGDSKHNYDVVIVLVLQNGAGSTPVLALVTCIVLVPVPLALAAVLHALSSTIVTSTGRINMIAIPLVQYHPHNPGVLGGLPGNADPCKYLCTHKK